MDMDTNRTIVERLVKAIPEAWMKTSDGFYRTQVTPEDYDELTLALKDVQDLLDRSRTNGADQVRR
jgi:hypothetical protein